MQQTSVYVDLKDKSNRLKKAIYATLTYPFCCALSGDDANVIISDDRNKFEGKKATRIFIGDDIEIDVIPYKLPLPENADSNHMAILILRAMYYILVFNGL